MIRRDAAYQTASDLVKLALIFTILLVFLFPFFWIFLTSVRPDNELFSDVFRLISETITFENYEALLESEFPRYIVNSLLVCIPATVIAVAVSFTAAYSFSRRRFRWRGPLLIVVVFSQLFPWVILVTPVYSLFYRLNLVNSFPGLIIAYIAITVPFTLYMLLGYLDSVPRELDEAAVIDGCSTLGTLWRVVLPVAWPGVAATAIYAFAQCWNEFLFALTLMTRNEVKTIPVGLAGFFGEYTTSWGLVMAASVLTTLPTLVIFLLLKRQLVSGLTAGAVK